jgi:hypothetical protein
VNDAPPASVGTRGAALEVRVCLEEAPGGAVEVSPFPWSLEWADGRLAKVIYTPYDDRVPGTALPGRPGGEGGSVCPWLDSVRGAG